MSYQPLYWYDEGTHKHDSKEIVKIAFSYFDNLYNLAKLDIDTETGGFLESSTRFFRKA